MEASALLANALKRMDGLIGDYKYVGCPGAVLGWSDTDTSKSRSQPTVKAKDRLQYPAMKVVGLGMRLDTSCDLLTCYFSNYTLYKCVKPSTVDTLGTWWSVLYTVEPLYCGHLGDLVKCPVYTGTPLLWTPWGPGEVVCIQWNPSIVDTLGTWWSVLYREVSSF